MYKLITTINLDGLEATNTVIRLSDNAYIPFDPDNTDYQAYLKFLAEGGQPLPADE
jgi:hypothetical protein